MTASSRHASTIWRFDGRIAQLDGGPFHAIVDVAAPRRGLTQLSYRDGALAGCLLGVDVAAEPSDAYVRESDLVVLYRETDNRPFSVQVYWSLEHASGADAVILDATVSIQTRQWEAYPRVVVASALDGADLDAVDAVTMIARPPHADWSYVEVTPPEDFARQTESADGPSASTSRWIFADQFMERGVIRRLRLRGAFLPRRDDVAAAARLRAALIAKQPPLTA